MWPGFPLIAGSRPGLTSESGGGSSASGVLRMSVHAGGYEPGMPSDEPKHDCSEHAWVLDDLDLTSHADQVFQCAHCSAVRHDRSSVSGQD